MTAKTRFCSIMPLFVLLYALAGACGATAAHDKEHDDSLEKVNRVFYGLNDIVDKGFVEPVAEGYVEYVPGGIRTGVSNFFDNLAYPGVLINNILQGKIRRAFRDTGRFLVNSTVGIGGIFDPATSMGLEEHEEDFGQTLGTWGADEGTYLVLPGLGANSARDVPGTVMGFFTNLLYYAEAGVFAPLFALYVIDRRAEMVEVSELRDKSLDPYVFTRDAYRQRREYLIYDGDPPLDEIYDNDPSSDGTYFLKIE